MAYCQNTFLISLLAHARTVKMYLVFNQHWTIKPLQDNYPPTAVSDYAPRKYSPKYESPHIVNSIQICFVTSTYRS